jgi:hypothetical protein
MVRVHFSDAMKGKLSVCFSFYFRDSTGFLYYSYRYPMRPCSLSFYKGNELKGIRNIKKRGAFSKIQRDKENGPASGAHKGESSVQSDRSVMVCVLCYCSFSPECWYKVSTFVLCTCHYSVDSGPYPGILSFGLPLLPPPFHT